MNRYEIAVIGGGPGGYSAAIRAAQLGKKTVLIEKTDVGGTCLNRGCIPTKALLHGTGVYAQLKQAKKLGINVSEYSFDYKKMVKRKDKVVRQLRSGVEALVKGHGADLVRGEAVLTGPHTFTVNGDCYEAEKIILASGSVPASIPIPGTDQPGVMDSTGALALETCPESVVIIGGGVIGVEFATLFSDLGKKVTILEMLPSILFGSDREVCETMTDLLASKGVAIYTDAKVQMIQSGPNCIFEKEGEIHTVSGEIVIMAAGRRPETATLDLKAAGVEADSKGFVCVDSEMRTNVPNIFAVGDITGHQQLAHVAIAQGEIAAHNAAGAHRVMDYSAIPSCIYTSPEIAGVGISEEAAVRAGYKIKVGRFDVSGNGRSVANGCQNGFIKVISEEGSGAILGCHIIAEHASEMIGEVTLAIRHGLSVEQVGNVVHAHPSVSEIIREAVHDVEGMCCHKL